MGGTRSFTLVAAAVWMLAGMILLPIPWAEAAEIPEQINYQGELNGVGGVPVDGLTPMEFKITTALNEAEVVAKDEILLLTGEHWVSLVNDDVVADSETVMNTKETVTYVRGWDYNINYITCEVQRLERGSIPNLDEVLVRYHYIRQPPIVWTETQTVDVDNGLFNVTLGAHTPIPPSVFSGKYRYLEVYVDGELLLPRQRLESVPYAMKSDTISPDAVGVSELASDIDASTIGFVADKVDGQDYSTDWPTTLANMQAASGNDFHALGGTDDDQPDSDAEVPDNISISNGMLHSISGTNGVGIGLTNPAYTLSIKSTGNYPFGIMKAAGNPLCTIVESNGYGSLRLRDDGGDIDVVLNTNGSSYFRGGNVGIGDVSVATRTLTVRGNFLLESPSTGLGILELGEGLDYAEGFDVSDEGVIAPGTVLIIDSGAPGNLTVSNKAYDTCVAGIVAGAEGLGSGVRLGIDDFDQDVALAGRVYCRAEALNASIEPGDLLTTSSIPGLAMKASDPTRRGGAILGKAMEGLARGETGMILVLVTLQ